MSNCADKALEEGDHPSRESYRLKKHFLVLNFRGRKWAME
jgi:hypothetical protein